MAHFIKSIKEFRVKLKDFVERLTLIVKIMVVERS